MNRHSEILKLHDEAREQYDTAQKTLSDLSADADDGQRKEAYEKFDTAMRAIDQKMERAQKLQELDQRDAQLHSLHGLSAGQIEDRSKDLAAQGVGGTSSLSPEQAESRYENAFVDYLRGFTGNDELRIEESRKIISESKGSYNVRQAMGLETRDTFVNAADQGGVLIPTQLMTSIYEYMQYYGCMNNDSLFTVLRTPNGNPIQFPRLAASEASSESVGTYPRVDPSDKTTAPTKVTSANDVTFDQMTLNAYGVDSGYIRASWDFIQDAPQGGGFVNAFLRDILAERMGRKINNILTTESTSGRPNGLLNVVTQTKNVNDASGPTANELKDLQHQIDIAYRGQPGVRWMFNDNTFLALRKLTNSQDSTGSADYIWDPADLRSGSPATVLAKPICINNQLPSYGGSSGDKPIIYGDLKKFYIRYAGGMRVRTLDELFALDLMIGIFMYTRLDSDLMDATALVASTLP